MSTKKQKNIPTKLYVARSPIKSSTQNYSKPNKMILPQFAIIFKDAFQIESNNMFAYSLSGYLKI